MAGQPKRIAFMGGSTLAAQILKAVENPGFVTIPAAGPPPLREYTTLELRQDGVLQEVTRFGYPPTTADLTDFTRTRIGVSP